MGSVWEGEVDFLCIIENRSCPHAGRDTECAVEHDTESDFMSCASATGDHNDFRVAVATAAAAREDTKKMEMDINLKSAVYGISLDKFTVAVSSLPHCCFAPMFVLIFCCEAISDVVGTFSAGSMTAASCNEWPLPKLTRLLMISV